MFNENKKTSVALADEENKLSEATRDIAKAFSRGEDVTNYKACDYCDKECDPGYSCGENCKCSIWRCSDCNGGFCESCFISEVGENEATQMFNGEESGIRCPKCYQSKNASSLAKIPFKIGEYVFTSKNALIPDSIGKIVGIADDDYPGTKEHFIVDFDDDGTCTVHTDDMSHTRNFPPASIEEGCVQP